MNTQCIKVAELRKAYDADIDLEKWMAMPNNLYVGRNGRVFIGGHIFTYRGSKWANPYKLSDYSLKDSLDLYEHHIISSGLLADISELAGKTLGCFCLQTNDCHAKVLVKLYNEWVTDSPD